jgi:hypothetical protein
VSALANTQVGEFINRVFVSTYVKVGTFTLVNGQKQGGNVATYFCLADGTVLHAVAGPIDGNSFLYEARWIVNVHQRASLEGRDDPGRYRQIIWEAHADRLARDFGIPRKRVQALHDTTAEGDGGFTDKGPLSKAKMDMLWMNRNHWDNRAQVHLLAALFPCEKIEKVYQHVFERILKEKVSSLPVVEK